MSPARRPRIAYVMALACLTIAVGACSFPTIEYDTSSGAGQSPACYPTGICATDAVSCGYIARDRNTSCMSCQPQQGGGSQCSSNQECSAELAQALAKCGTDCETCASMVPSSCANFVTGCAALVNYQ